jgi:iron complex outermembrane receptor protein
MRKNSFFILLVSMFTALHAQDWNRRDSMLVELEEVTVTSLRANERSAVSYTTIAAAEIAKINHGQDIPFLLALTPSFVATSETGTGIGYTGFRIRGTDANRVNITVNGIPLNDAESHTVFFVNMPDFASSLSSIQVQRGVGTSTHGAAAFGASINMETERLRPVAYAEIATSLGSFRTNKNMLKAGTGLIDDRWAFDMRLSNIVSDGYVDRSSVDMKSWYFNGGYYGKNSTVKLITFGGNEKTYQAWNGVRADSLATNRTYNEIGEYYDDQGVLQFYDNQTDNYTQTHYQLHWLQRLNRNLALNVAAHYTRGIGYYEDYKQGRRYNEYGLTAPVINGVTLSRSDLVRQKWLDNHFAGLVWSLNYSGSNLSASLGGAANRYDGDHFGKVVWVRNAAGLDIGKDWYRNTGVKDDANVFAKITAEVLPSLYLNLDAQYRYIRHEMEGRDDKFDKKKGEMRTIDQSHLFHFFNPKTGLTYRLSGGHDLYGSFSIANREPNRKNYTEAGPNEKPTHETLYNYELGYRYHSSKLSAGANLYWMQYRNQLILTGKISEIGVMLTSNIPDSYRRGVELMAAWKPVDWFQWDGSLTLSQNRILNFIEQDVDMYDAGWNWIGLKSNELGNTTIAFSPSVVANNRLTFNINKVELALLSNLVGKQYIDNTNSDDRSMPAYFVTNLSVGRSFALAGLKSLNMQVLVNNLLDETYVSNGYVWYSNYLDGKRVNDLRYFPQAGRHFLATVTLRF